MIDVNLVFLLLILHFFADFILQTDWQAKNKSSDNTALGTHALTYSLVFFFILFFVFGSLYSAILFALITFWAHAITDGITSRWSKRYYAKGDNHNFFVVIGLDQFLHYLQLILTFLYVYGARI